MRVMIPIIINYKQTKNAVVLLDKPKRFDKLHIICNNNVVGKNKTIVKDWVVVDKEKYPDGEDYFDFDTSKAENVSDESES